MEVAKRNRKNDAITAFAIALLQLAYKMNGFFLVISILILLSVWMQQQQ